MMHWYNLGGKAWKHKRRGYNTGDLVYIPNDAGTVSAADIVGDVDMTGYVPDNAIQVGNEYLDYGAGQGPAVANEVGEGDFADAGVIDPYALADNVVTNADQFTQDNFSAYEQGSGNLLGNDYQVASDPISNIHEQGYVFDENQNLDYIDESEYEDTPLGEFVEYGAIGAEVPDIYTSPDAYAEYVAGEQGSANATGGGGDDITVPPVVAPPAVTGGGAVPAAYSPVGSYISGPGTPGVNTGIPQGGHAANAIQQYLTGAAPATLSYGAAQAAQQVGDADFDQQAYIDNLGAQSDAILNPVSDDDDVDLTGGAGEIETLGGNTLSYDTPLEEQNANNIAQIIEEGGINPETGDPNIVAGPNTLSAGDEGLFGYGSDYNEEFVENYNAQSEHSDNNPTGQTTGTPLYEQGYLGTGNAVDDAIGGLINNSTIGLIGNAITGEDLVPGIDALLPPEESFSNYDSGNDSNDNDNSWQNDGNPANDQGNAGWGFTSISDMFDGGGPGQSGDSYSGGIHGDDTVGDTDEGLTSIVSDWFGGGSSSDSGSSDSGSSSSSSSGGGYSCYVATALNDAGLWSDIRKLKLLAWCMKTKPEGKLDTTLWRNGYCEFGKKIIAPRVDNRTIQWLSDGFYDSTVRGKRDVKSLLGKAFFYIPSYSIGLFKMATGKLQEIDRT